MRQSGWSCRGMGVAIMADKPLVGFVWRVLDALDY
jgi:hypothetical protein